MERVFISWSGGKDSCLACYRAIARGLGVDCLLNTVTHDGTKSFSHGIAADLLRTQSLALQIPIVQVRTTPESYEVDFVNAISKLKQRGIDGGVFGDIDIAEHREWVQKVCRKAGVTAYLPLWGESQDRVLAEFIDSGFQAIVVATRADLLGEDWLGRRLDGDFIRELAGAEKPITPCGESGEYHTLVVDGPLFTRRLEILETRRVLRDGHWILEILNYELKPKVG